MDNFAAQPLNTQINLAFIQHEPGSVCTTLIDCPFGTNLDGPMGCLRYYSKSYNYGSQAGGATYLNCASAVCASTNNQVYPRCNVRFPKIMAKIPTVRIFGTANGFLGYISDDISSANVAATANDIGEDGMGSVNCNPTALTAGHVASFQWDADTGW
jgi:hypothetical protein